MVCHRRAGKTVAAINDMLNRALHINTATRPNPRFGYIAPYRTQVKDIAWVYLKEAVRDIPNCKISESELSVVLPNKARIRLYGADNEDALRGGYFDGVIFDEYGDIAGSVYSEVVSPMLVDRDGWVVFMGTPKGKNAFYSIREAAKANPKKYYHFNLPASESGHLNPDFLLEKQAEMDPDEYAREYECSFEASIKGSYYGNRLGQLEAEGRFVDNLQPHRFAQVDIAFDLGLSDATAAWFFQVADGKLLILDHYEINGLSMPEIASQIVDKARLKGYQLGKWYLPHDARARNLQTGKSTIEQLALLVGYDRVLVGPEHYLQDGISAVRKVLDWDIWFDKTNCYDGLDALKAYSKSWDPDKKTFSNKPKHDASSHSADAFRYLACVVQESELQETGKRKRPPKTEEEVKVEWEETGKVNIEVEHRITLDDLFEAREARLAALDDY